MNFTTIATHAARPTCDSCLDRKAHFALNLLLIEDNTPTDVAVCGTCFMEIHEDEEVAIVDGSRIVHEDSRALLFRHTGTTLAEHAKGLAFIEADFAVDSPYVPA